MGLILDAYGRPTSQTFAQAHAWIAREALQLEASRQSAARVRELRWSVLGQQVAEGRTLRVTVPPRYRQEMS